MYDIYEISNNTNGFFVYFLNVITSFSLISAIFVVIVKNPIYSVLFLISLFVEIAVYLIFIGLNFLGLSYLLVYVGAVSILFLFILMLINIRVSELIEDTNNNIPLAVLVILAFFLPLSNILPNSQKNTNIFTLDLLLEKKEIKYVSSNYWEGVITDTSDITSIGQVMYTNYNIWLIITSLILLLAMVGSIVITLRQKEQSY